MMITINRGMKEKGETIVPPLMRCTDILSSMVINTQTIEGIIKVDDLLNAVNNLENLKDKV